ncbi:MAG TPA: hypothetical protein VIK91_13950, partial [Nannocystis sp.]
MSLRRISSRLCTTAAALVLLLGCDADSKKPEAPKPALQAASPPAPPPAPAVTDPPAPPPADQPPAPVADVAGQGSVVALLDPGAEPRTPLRLKLTAGQQQAMVMTMRMGIAMQIAGQKPPRQTIPPMQMTMNLSV